MLFKSLHLSEIWVTPMYLMRKEAGVCYLLESLLKL